MDWNPTGFLRCMQMADLAKSIRMSVESGKVIFGSRQVVKAALDGAAKAIVLSSTAPGSLAADIRHYAKLSGVPVINFGKPSKELGAICGVPYLVSAAAVLQVGNSDIMSCAPKPESNS
ncbi:50S ribosomal protein L30e [Candidatus Parvarchaeota archaeon]|nr:50S ribosomal protein L30e [Candidatus Parvarchaeota archaeon]